MPCSRWVAISPFLLTDSGRMWWWKVHFATLQKQVTSTTINGNISAGASSFSASTCQFSSTFSPIIPWPHPTDHNRQPRLRWGGESVRPDTVPWQGDQSPIKIFNMSCLESCYNLSDGNTYLLNFALLSLMCPSRLEVEGRQGRQWSFL